MWFSRLFPWRPWRTLAAPVWMPEGNGVFVSRLRQLSSIEDRIERGNLNWVAVLRDFHGASRLDRRTKFNRTRADLKTIRRLQDAGVDVVAWSYPSPGHERAYVDSLAAAVSEWGAVSIMVDPEAPYIGRHAGHPNAQKLNAMMRKAADKAGVSYGFTSYAGVWNFDEPIGVFPFAAFTDCDYAIPQTYTYSQGYVEKAHRAYLSQGFKPEQMVGAFGSYRNTNEALRALIGDCYAQGVPAVCGWKWETTSIGEFEVLGEFGESTGVKSA